jgi:hypothetical protein
VFCNSDESITLPLITSENVYKSIYEVCIEKFEFSNSLDVLLNLIFLKSYFAELPLLSFKKVIDPFEDLLSGKICFV